MMITNEFNHEKYSDIFKISFIKYSSSMIGILIILTSYLRIHLSGYSVSKLTVPFVVGTLFIWISFESRKKGFVKYHAYIILLGFSFIALNGGYYNGGLQAPVAAGLFILPLIGGVLLDKTGAIFGFGLNLFCLALLSILDSFHLVHPFNGNLSNIFYPIIYSSISLITFSIIISIQKAKKENDDLLDKMYQEIVFKAQLSSLVKLSEGMSHEINNPLAIISIKNQKILQSIQDLKCEDKKEIQKIISSVNKIQAATDRITKTVSALFQFSHSPENEKVTNHLLKDILDYSLETVYFRGVAREVLFKINYEQEIIIHVKKSQLCHVIINILNNAIDSLDNSQEKWIEISAISSSTSIQILITDSGPGVPKNLQDKILLPFFTTKEIGKGSGMGLSVSLGMMHSMGGDLWLDKESVNTRFVIEIPHKLL